MLDCDDEALRLLNLVIGRGELAVIPTDTVYGVVCDPFNRQAIDRLFAAKHRPSTKSIQILLPSLDLMDQLDLTLPSPLDLLADRFLPGSISLISKAGGQCQLSTLRQEDGYKTQAIRVPDCRVSRAILTVTGPLAASSANQSGHSSVCTVTQARQELGDAVSLYVDGGPTPGSVASTVVTGDRTDPDGIRILRQGLLKQEDLRQAIREGQSGGGTE